MHFQIGRLLKRQWKRKEGRALPQSGGTQKNKRRIRFFQICVVFLCINVEGERMHERKNLGGLVPPFLSSSKRPAWNPVCERADGRLATFRFAPPGNRAKKPSRYRYFSFCSLVKKQSTEWAFVTRSSSLFFLSVDRSFTHETHLQIQLHISHLLPPSPVSIASLFQNVSPRPIHPSNT